VAVATALEAATPTAIQTLVLLAHAGLVEPAEAQAAASLCNGCGACTAFCKHHVPVADQLRALRARPVAAPLAAIDGDAPVVCILAEDGPDWSSDYAAAAGLQVARLRTTDALGHDAWRAGDADVPRRLAEHLHGRRVVTDQLDIRDVLEAASVPVAPLAPPAGVRRFVTCFEGVAPGTPHQLSCCGRREGLPQREPAAAAAVARENARRMADGDPGPGSDRRGFGGQGATGYACADAACARWLSAHGAAVRGPSTDADGAGPVRPAGMGETR
jgi:ferredoxin